jgi:NTE family protein
LATPDTETNYVFFENREALVLAGGGARAAYQVGVLRAIADWLPPDAPCPFEVLVGTSAGALNAAALAARASRFDEAVGQLERTWAGFRVQQVVRSDAGTVLQAGLHWAFSMLTGGWLLPPPRSLLDTSPLRELLQQVIPSNPGSIAEGPSALAVATTSYTAGRSFFDAMPMTREWTRARRAGVRRAIDLDVLMASSAIPFIFPSARVDSDFYGDGAMRQLAPLSPAVHLGANRMLVVGTRADAGAAPIDGATSTPPSPGHLLGFVLDSLFTDGLSIDLERLRQINDLLAAEAIGNEPGRRPIEVLVISPATIRPQSRGATSAPCHAACACCCARSARSKPAAACSRVTCCSRLRTRRN